MQHDTMTTQCGHIGKKMQKTQKNDQMLIKSGLLMQQIWAN